MTNAFSIGLITKSSTAIQLNIKEQFTPAQGVVDNAKLLFDKVLSKIPFDYYINSFYRCPRLNKAVGGSATSDHTLGRSADLDSTDNVNNKKIFDWIKSNCDFDQLIWEFGNDNAPDWVHVSYRAKGNRKQVLRAIKNKAGKTTYIVIK